MKEKANEHRTDSALPKNLELLGLAVPRLIHELNNTLTVLAGNIDLADRLLDQPDTARERLRSAKDTLTRFDRRIVALASWIRQLPQTSSPCPVAKIAAELEQRRDAWRPWKLQLHHLPPIHTTISPPWFRFLQDELRRHLHSNPGLLSLSCVPISRPLRYFSPPEPSASRRVALTLQLDWRSPQPSLPPDEWEKPIQPEWLILFELIRWFHGDIHYGFDSTTSNNQLAFYLPALERLPAHPGD